MQTIAFIINPKSGTNRFKKVEAIAEKLLEEHYQLQFYYTTNEHRGDIQVQYAIENGADKLVAVGGDGSIHDLVNGMMRMGQYRPVGIIPMGSGNGLARSLKLPLNIKKAILLLKSSNLFKIDIGCINDFYFVSNIGVGFDSKVARAFASSNSRGLWTYTVLSVKNMFGYKPMRWSLKVDGQSYEKELFMLNFCNIPQFGNNFYIAPNASMQNGKLDVVMIPKLSLWQLPILTIAAFTKQLDRLPFVKIVSGQQIELTAQKDFYAQADGDFIHYFSKIKISVLPQVLSIIVP